MSSRSGIGIRVAGIAGVLVAILAAGSVAAIGASGDNTGIAAKRKTVKNASLLRGKRPSVAPRPNTIAVRDRQGQIRGGAQGPVGPAGPQGPPGPQGVPGLSDVQIVTRWQVVTESWNIEQVLCPSGKRVIGGGAEALGQQTILKRTSPNDAGNGWLTVGYSPTGEEPIAVNIWAICAKVQ